MKNAKKFTIISLIIVSLVLPFVVSVDVSAATKINTTKKTLYVGENYILKITGTTKTVKWSSNKTSVASISAKGKVIAKKIGNATITGSVGVKKYSCKITVKKEPALNDLESYLLEKDILFGEKDDISSILETIGAVKGFQYIEGKYYVAVFEYDTSSKEYKDIVKKGYVKVVNTKLPISAKNGKFILFCETSNDAEVIKAFKSFK